MWKKLKKLHSNKLRKDHYFRIKADSLVKIAKQSYQTSDATLTFCRCSHDETPAWQFDSSRVLYQEDDSIFLQRPVFKIKGVPILPLPSIQLPATTKRKPGLLFPLFAYHGRSGIIYKQDYYYPLFNYSEFYLGGELHESRGLKAQARYNSKWSPRSFTQVKLDFMKDQKWVNENEGREGVISFYEENPSDWEDSSRILSCLQTHSASHCFNKRIRPHLNPAKNKTRGRIEWHNVSQLNEEWRFLSLGLLTSDHRYMDEVDFYQLRNFKNPYIKNRFNGFYPKAQFSFFLACMTLSNSTNTSQGIKFLIL